MSSVKNRKCKHCHKLFRPDPRNAKRQKYCSNPECRKASKAASQKKWLNKPENKNYFRGPENVKRVQEWRRKNPGYWQKEGLGEILLQDRLKAKSSQKQEIEKDLPANALQDVLSAQPVVLLGLLSHITGSALQDDIATAARHMRQLGQDILNQPFCCKGGKHDNPKTADLFTSGSPDT